jgi:hypothetical protein
VLHKAAYRPELVKVILSFLPEQDRLELVKIQDQDGRTVLHLVSRSPESLQVILEHLLENDRLPALLVQDRRTRTALSEAYLDNSESLNIIIKHLTMTQRISAIARENLGSVLNKNRYVFQCLLRDMTLYDLNNLFEQVPNLELLDGVIKLKTAINRLSEYAKMDASESEKEVIHGLAEQLDSSFNEFLFDNVCFDENSLMQFKNKFIELTHSKNNELRVCSQAKRLIADIIVNFLFALSGIGLFFIWYNVVKETVSSSQEKRSMLFTNCLFFSTKTCLENKQDALLKALDNYLSEETEKMRLQ